MVVQVVSGLIVDVYGTGPADGLRPNANLGLFKEYPVDGDIAIRSTVEDDWRALKAVRLAALIDSPMAFGVSHATALTYSDFQWRERAAGKGPALYTLAFSNDEAVGMVGCVVNASEEFNLIAMWVTPQFRGTATAARLVNSVKAESALRGHSRVVLDVAPTNLRAVSFYQRMGFVFLPQWEPLESYPHIQLQKMEYSVSC